MTGKNSPLYRFGLCLNKMYDSMMGAKPIICAINAPMTLVEEYKCGIQVNPATPNGLKEAVMRIKEMDGYERIAMGKNGRTAVIEHFTYKKLANQFITAVSK